MKRLKKEKIKFSFAFFYNKNIAVETVSYDVGFIMNSVNERYTEAAEFLKKKFKNRFFTIQMAEKYMHFTVIRELEEVGLLEKSESNNRYRVSSRVAVVA